ncbi:integumentary mucin C.1-like [Paramacrobiotus metropolitanus]|uniref:integumentary mucin C.1-like n=1 Tax=Paramacrobiotus metropolitanus TaxID=2943436 RepID=UPI002445DAB5|nr:integumentary mucin C.1-like [Paramacrobiotus metropolitanus]
MQLVFLVYSLFSLKKNWFITAQPLLPMPAGKFNFLTDFFPILQPVPLQPAATPSPISPEQPAISRSAAADLFSSETAETAFVRKCAGHVSKAALNCPCAAPGHSCAPSYSVCSENNHCICDPATSYINATNTGCTPYPTTTACPAVTCPTTTSATCPVCPTTTADTCSTTTSSTSTASSTTTTTATTTAAPSSACKATPEIKAPPNPLTTGCGGCITVPASGTVAFTSPVAGTDEFAGGLGAGANTNGDYPNNAFCVWTIEGPLGKQLLFTEDPLVTFNIADGDQCEFDALYIDGQRYCMDAPFTTPQTVSNPTVVVFSSDSVNTGTGWKMNIKAV